MAPRLLNDPTAVARLRRDLWLASDGNSTAYDVSAGLARFLHAKHDQEPESREGSRDLAGAEDRS